MSFKNIDPKKSFPELEEEILKFWEENKIFEKSLENRKDSPKFIFYEGPPTANGKPGVHHVLARSFKDLIPRYKTMRGFSVSRKAGWDTHGLPVEIAVEKKLGLKNKKEIEEYGIEKFNAECKKSVWEYKEDWEKLTKRIGFWVDMENPYITYENDYIDKVWQVLKKIWDKELLYEDYKVVPFCPRCGTPLSSHEVAQGYKKIKEPSVFLKFKLKNEPNTFILSWTTTPWTLPGNVALAVGEKIEYSKIKVNDENWILASELINKVIKEKYEITEKIMGNQLVGLEYIPLFDIPELKSDKSYKVYSADFVTTEEGTGVVHTAVMYGEDDYSLGIRENIPKFHTVDVSGKFIPSLKDLGGLYIKSSDAEEKIISELKKNNNYLESMDYEHDYPFCWRCDSPLIYYAKSSWFIAVSKVRNELVKNNQKINWIPEYIKNGRFGEWLAEVKDWALSRERYWGTPLPIWECKCGEKIFIGSLGELKEKAIGEIKNLDLHRPYVDEIKIKCPKCGEDASRIKDLIDVWFDSGSMPYASGEFDKGNYPADFISEALDQTRGWFYTLLAISTLIGEDEPYKNVICLGLVLDEEGKKMSKSRGNILEPWSVIDKYGADALRWLFYTINAPGDSKRIGEKEVAESMRKFNMILWNVYSFFVTYANVDKWEYEGGHWEPKETLDRWIVSYFYKLIDDIEKKLDVFDIIGAARAIEEFNTDLSTWYLRRSRKRRDKDFYATMFKILIHFTKVIAPFTPFLAESIYQNLKTTGAESVHLCDWPKVGEVDEELLSEMAYVRSLAEKGRALRAEKNIRTRQPLQSFTIDKEVDKDYMEILKEELNVIEVKVGNKIELDTKITPELQKEGDYRDLLRIIQDLRKKSGLKPGENVDLHFKMKSDNIKDIVLRRKDEIEKLTNVKMIEEESTTEISENQYTVDTENIWLSLK